jgi:eukaryotic-like serine/threonine-protein kinase
MSDPATRVGSGSHELSGQVGKYEIRQQLGRGAMGVVYLAYDTVLERDVALKVMAAQIADDPGVYERFVREARSVAKMTHPNVVTVFDLGTHTDGSPFIAMELLKGQDLSKALRTGGLSLERKLNVVLQVLAALGHAHRVGIVHRDIKPANIFLTHDGPVKLMDFGIARLTTASLTGTGTIVGTADYMSPEQVQAAKVDGRSDIFSLGCVLFEMVCGQRPFHAEELMAIFYRITHQEPDYTLVKEAALLPVLRKALAKDLTQRYATAEALGAELRAVMGTLSLRAVTADTGSAPTMVGSDAPTYRDGTPTAVPGGTHVQRAPGARPQAAAGRPAVLYAGIAAAVLIALGAAGVWFLKSRPAPSPAPAIDEAVVTPPGVDATPVSLPPITVATPAPPPTFAEVAGAAAPAMRAAQNAFKAGDYARAAEQARMALAQDPGSAPARTMLDRAAAGERARARVSAGEAALRAGDHARAMGEAQAAREAAPWDVRATDLVARVQEAERRVLAEAQQRAQREAQAQREVAAGQVNTLLGQAESALAGQKYDAAIDGFDKALALDPQNARALQGRSGAITARAIAQAAQGQGQPGAPRAPGRAFVPARTTAHGADARTQSVPDGFAETPGVDVKRGSQAAELPGKIVFQVEPETVAPGGAYKVRIFLLNEGSASIQVRDMVVATEVNGRKARAPVPPLAREVAPRQRALLREVSDVWKQDVGSWSMEVLVRTVRGEAYENRLTWQ